MITSPQTSFPYRPEGDERIPLGTLGYMEARNRNRVYDLVIKEFMNSGLSQATLARRLGKRPDVVCRWLGSPGNWTLDTVSNLLFAISGAEASYSLAYPADEAARNYIGPEWLLNAEITEADSTDMASIILPEERSFSHAG